MPFNPTQPLPVEASNPPDDKCGERDREMEANAPFGLGSFSKFLKNRDPVKQFESFKLLYNSILGNISGITDEDQISTGRYVCYEWPKIITPRFFSTDIVVINNSEDATKYKTKLLPGWNFSFLKFIYCLFLKFLIFPVPQLMMIVIRYTVMFLLMIIEPLKAIIFSILNSTPYVGAALVELKITKVEYMDENCSLQPHYPTIGDGFFYLIGLATPFFKIYKEKEAHKYGSGELFFFILTIMVVSTILIIIGGSSIGMLYAGFFYYCFKLIKVLTSFEKDEKSSAKANTNANTKPPA